MNERLQKNCLNFFSFYNVTGEAHRKIRFKSIMRCPRFVWEKRHTAKSDLKALCVVRDLFGKKGILFVRSLKFAYRKYPRIGRYHV